MVNHHPVVKMIPSGQPCSPGKTDSIALGDQLIFFNVNAAEMAIQAEKAEPMVYNHGLTINTEVFGKHNASIVGSRHR